MESSRFSLFDALTGVIAAALGVALGWAVVGNEELLHLPVPGFWTVVGIAACALVVSAWILLRPTFALQLLLAFVWCNVSQVLVREHGWPSLLQLLVIPLLAAAWGARSVRISVPRGLETAIGGLAVLYVLVLVASLPLARDVTLAWGRIGEHVKSLVVWFLVASLVLTLGAVRRGIWTLLLAGGVLAGIGIFQVATGRFDWEFGGLGRVKNAHIVGDIFEPRIAGPLGDPNFLAQILVVLVPLALFLGWSEKRLGPRLLAWGTGAVIAAGSVLTYSRGGALALGVVLVLVVLHHGIRARTVAASVLLGAVVFPFLPQDFTRRVTTIREILPGGEEVLHPDSSFEKRKLLMKVAWRTFLDHPVLGVGVGNYTCWYEDYADEVGSASRQYEDPDALHYTHNLPLEIAAETGIAGLGVFVLLVGASYVAFVRARRLFLAAGNDRGALLAKGFEIALTGCLVTGLFLHLAFPRYLWVLFGFAAALHRLAAGEEVR